MKLQNSCKALVITALLISVSACQNSTSTSETESQTETIGQETTPQPIETTTPNEQEEESLVAVEPEENSNQRYFCGKSQDDTPTTFARSVVRGKVAVIRWERDNWQNTTPEERCEEVSARFERVSKANNLQYLTRGFLNEQPIVCGVSSYGDACKEENLLLTLQPRFRTSKCSIKKYIVLKSPKIIPGQEYFSFH